MDRPLLALDKPFTYDLTADLAAGVGSLVQVPFHGRAVRGWVLGSTDDVPSRVLAVRKVVSPIRFFDEPMLRLARWVSEHYVVPLAAVLTRISPPRVVSEEDEEGAGRRGTAGAREPAPPVTDVLTSRYRGGGELVEAIGRGAGSAFVLRPAPEDEQVLVVEAVAACLTAGRRAVVLVPEARPVPATAAAVIDVFGDRSVTFLGGDRRSRYRTWLRVAEGQGEVVVGTRPAVYAPVRDLGLIYVSRESHPAHREDRSPYSHVRDVALARVRLEGAVGVLSAVCPSSEAAASGLPQVAPASRRWPSVEVVRPGPEGRAPRLLQALAEVDRGFLFSPLPGYGVAQVCRACGSPAACATCGGLLRVEAGAVRCVVCEAPGRCRSCGATRFGIRRGGAERVEEWANRVARAPVRRIERPRLPRQVEIVVGGPDVVRDLGAGGLDLVAILDADLAGRRPGLASRERALCVWMEAIAWTRPGGRAIVQASDARDPAIQALVRGNPARFHEDERWRREQAGFPVGAPVFRVAGGPDLPGRLRELEPLTLLSSAAGEQTVCLLALAPERLLVFGRVMRDLAARGEVVRVEAEPHL